MLNTNEKRKKAEQIAEEMLNDYDFELFEKGTIDEAEAIIDVSENTYISNELAQKQLDKGVTSGKLQELNEIAEMVTQIILAKLSK